MSALHPSPAEMADYLADYYGTCERGSSFCYFSGCNGPSRPWLGRGCPNWRPSGARDLAELSTIQERAR
jgi:hypothetical protein